MNADAAFERQVDALLRDPLTERLERASRRDDRLGRASPQAFEVGWVDDSSVRLHRAPMCGDALRTDEHLDVFVAYEDVDVRDFADVEWSLWTRVADAARYRIRADVPSWELERCARPGRGSLRIAIDATVDPADRDKLRRTMIPGASRVRLADYL